MFTLTSSATNKIADLIAAESDNGSDNHSDNGSDKDTSKSDNGLALRVAVKPGGCSGFSYEMYFDSEFADDDSKAQYGDVHVVMDPSSAKLLEGATLDYADGLQQTGFSINNPNAQRTCGCGKSFC